jgi:hypothetical protein
VARCSRVIQLNLHIGLVHKMFCGVNSQNIRLTITDFFNGCPGLKVRGVSSVCILVAIAAIAVVAVAIVVVRSTVVSIVVAVVSVAVVVSAVGVIASPGRVLTFLIPPLGPAIQLVVAQLVAVETFNIALVALLLTICSKGLVRAVLLALLYNTAVELVRDKTNDLVRGDGISSAVSCHVDTTDSRCIRGGKGAKQNGCEFIIVQVLPHRSKLLLEVDKSSKMCMSIVLIAQSSALKFLAKVHSDHLGSSLVNTLDSIPYLHGSGFAFDTIENMVRDQSGDHILRRCFFSCPMLVRHKTVDFASCYVGGGSSGTSQMLTPESRVKCPGHMIPVRDPIRSVHGKLSDGSSSEIITHGDKVNGRSEGSFLSG